MSRSRTMAGIAAILFAAAAHAAADDLPKVVINDDMAPMPSAPGLQDTCDAPGSWTQRLDKQGQKSVMKIEGKKKIHEIFANADTGEWSILETETGKAEDSFTCKVNQGQGFKTIQPFLDINPE